MADFRDRIYLKDLRVACIIGVRPEERTRKQEIAIDVCLHVDLEGRTPAEAAPEVCEWAAAHHVEILNVAGPRASNDSGIYALVRELLEQVLEEEGCVQGALSKE